MVASWGGSQLEERGSCEWASRLSQFCVIFSGEAVPSFSSSKITCRALSKPRLLATPEFLIQWICGGARDAVFLISSQVLLLLPVQRPL